jgi:hypothetical protein
MKATFVALSTLALGALASPAVKRAGCYVCPQGLSSNGVANNLLSCT